MTQTTLDVLERLGGWKDRFKYEFEYPRHVFTDIDEDGVMWVINDHGAKEHKLEYMDIDGATYVRESQ